MENNIALLRLPRVHSGGKKTEQQQTMTQHTDHRSPPAWLTAIKKLHRTQVGCSSVIPLNYQKV